MNSPSLIAAYIFGSTARGDRDERSDLDILAIVRDGGGKVDVGQISNILPDRLKSQELSISWYGLNRLNEMFSNGELFAWHLHQETIPIFEVEPIIQRMGIPAPYTGSVDDICSFQNILCGIPTQVSEWPDNAVYEIGLIYVCLRNIAMAASWSLAPRPDFSRYSPFNLQGLRELPITRAEYELAMTCRMAGQRGMSPPLAANDQMAQDIYGRLSPWIEELRQLLVLEH
jgi:hypothetical protein